MIKTGILNKKLPGAAAGIAAALIALLLWQTGLLEKWELHSWDSRVRKLAAPSDTSGRIVIILLDQNSLDWGSTQMGLTWPWPREVYAAIVHFCNRTRAKSLSFDVLFSEPSAYGVRDDLLFAEALSRYGKVALPVFLSHFSGLATKWPQTLPKPAQINLFGSNHTEAINTSTINIPRAAFPVPEIAEAAAVLCNVNQPPGPDNIHRSVRLFSRFDGHTIPSLGLGAFIAAGDRPSKIGRKTLFGPPFFDTSQNPGSTAIVKYRGRLNTYKVFSAASVIQSELRLRNGQKPPITELAAFKDKYVFFGFSAPGLLDLRATPADGMNPGVGIHATVLDNYLSGDFMAPLNFLFSLPILFLCTVAAGFLVSQFSRALPAALISASFVATPFIAGDIAYQSGYWFPTVLFETGIVLCIVLVLLNNYITQGRQKRFIKNAFGQYLNPRVIEQILRHPEKLALGGERRTITVFFSDIQNFTQLCENLEPEEVALFLNQYMSIITQAIHDQGGTIDKYEGDAVMAFWNAPLKMSDHAARAVRAALMCQQQMDRKQRLFKAFSSENIATRIGIATGPAVVGNMGSEKRFDYTAIGDTVNLASRLETANKEFNTRILISSATRQMLDDSFIAPKIGDIMVKGKKKPVTVYTILGRNV